jgi:hypothetical protein
VELCCGISFRKCTKIFDFNDQSPKLEELFAQKERFTNFLRTLKHRIMRNELLCKNVLMMNFHAGGGDGGVGGGSGNEGGGEGGGGK